MDTFEIYKFLHVSLAIIWVGGGIFGAILTERAKSTNPEHRLGIARDMATVSSKVFAPAAILTLLFGVLMVLDVEAIEFQDTWISIGLGAIVLSIVLGAGYLGPQSGKLVAELESGADGAMDRLRRVALISYIDLFVLLVAVWAMVAKPGA